MGAVIAGLGIALFRKHRLVFRILGCVVVGLGVGAIGLSVMVDAKKA